MAVKRRVYWIPNLLRLLDAPFTDANRKLLFAWWAWEGGATGPRGNVNPSAKRNPLNTMRKAPGSTDFNSVHVQNYPTYKVGLQATHDTLKQTKYAGLVKALRSGKPLDLVHDKGLRAGLSCWVSGKPDTKEGKEYAERVIKSARTWEL
jgi:hypothetical protein